MWSARARRWSCVALAVAFGPAVSAEEEPTPPRATMASVLAASSPADWAPLDPANTLYLTLPSGRVVIRLTPEVAPRHVANIKALVAERYYDGLAVIRSQDNYVVQWGDPAPEGGSRRPVKSALTALPAEFESALAAELRVTTLEDADPYAPEVGFVHGLPVGLDREGGTFWPAHCYGMVGVARDVSPDSGNGTEIYVVIGHAPRHLDRNVTLVGRVVEGIERLSTLPRGTGNLGFYEDPADGVPLVSVRLGSELSPRERSTLEALRTDTRTFSELIAARRSRAEQWFAHPAGRIGLCNVPLPVRERREK